MPEPVDNAVCGPTVPGTSKADAGTDLTDLNPCPLKACCNVWGQCGLNDDFCIASPSKSGAPGTSGLRNGCVSNCGRELVKGAAPASKIKIAYFEAWNSNRKCLNMDVTDIDTNVYTHIHFAFAEVTSDFKVDVSKVQKQFDKFKGMSGVKKIISFGGWDFSALPGTFNILRTAVLPANRDTFKNNVVSFVNEHGLDGVDIDWEYPGAPDIPDIPADDPKNGANYLKFLAVLKNSMGSGKSVSFAAPASYWYLRAYPIAMMSKFIDYIVYMTYDLHGQWDYGNKWTSPGCDTGNCLRSHVNDTETKDALVMITKAGVPTGKVVVGVASYGRSFKMESAGCDGPECKFTGSARASNAAKGRCTDTGGYISNAEIEEIIASGKVNRQWKAADSNILVYSDTEWVAYMDNDIKESRSKFYDSYNFAGTTDWAVDLQSFSAGDGGGDDEEDDSDRVYDPNYLGPCEGSYKTIEDIERSKDNIPAHCIEQYLTQIQPEILADSIRKYDKLIDDGYDHWFSVYERYVKQQTNGQIEEFMGSSEAKKYFKCTVTDRKKCCCRYYCKPEDFKDCDRSSSCNGNAITTRDIDCPTHMEEYSITSSDLIPKAKFIPTDKEGFFKVLYDKYGIEEDWIHFGKKLMRLHNGCQYAGEEINKCMDENNDFYYDFPIASYDDIKVFNPKDLMHDSYEKVHGMRDDYELLALVLANDEQRPYDDAFDAMSIPSLGMKTSSENMQSIVDAGKKIEEQERKEFILNMIFGFLAWIPIIGEFGAAAGTAVRTLCRLIGEIGDAALTTYQVIDDPNSALSTIFGFMVGKVIDTGALRKAGAARRNLKDKDIDGMGSVKKDLDRLEDVRKTCLCK